MSYEHQKIENYWQNYWKENNTFEVTEDSEKPKFYVLDMFPYPSGAGLHVGHPLGYIASDIITRYKRLCGYNVLHPMGYDSFGLPAEQYAIKTGKHPAIATAENVARYREQLENLGLSYDWSREVKTSDPSYYKHTQWIFLKLFDSWYDSSLDKARDIKELKLEFKKSGNTLVKAAHHCEEIFDAKTWNEFGDKEQEEILQCYRLAYRAQTSVNWCPGLGTVLANDEVKEGFSVRGAHRVFQKSMMQWCLRITAYAKRLLDGLDKIDWSDSLKEMQRNWIGRSVGAEIDFKVEGTSEEIKVFTTRADTIFGATFMVLAPESEYVSALVTQNQKIAVDEYLELTQKRSERERIAEVKKVSGVFSGSYCINPFTQEKIPVWIADYVLGGYGTGAIMAVPAHDARDYSFASHFCLPIVPIIKGADVSEASMDAKSGVLVNSGFLDGLDVKDAIKRAIEEVEKKGLGKRTVNYKLRDAIFSRQRYWGEPFPIYFENEIPRAMDYEDLPLELPEVDKYLPTEDGEPPLARANSWVNKDGHQLEYSTMPGFAGSSAYFLRYMDPKNSDFLVSKSANEYWRDVDLYVGGVEHATGHLLYSRCWNMFLFDLGFVCEEEPFKKLVNQGMIQGRSNFVYRVKGSNKFVSYGLKDQYDTMAIHVDVNIVKNDILNQDAFRAWMPEYKDAEFILEENLYKCGYAQEKMSKSKYNVVNPDQICEEYGADTLRLYEMFLGPIEQSKPWNTNGIEGVYRFIQKYWKLVDNDLLDTLPTPDELKVLHTAIKKVSSDLEVLSLNTSVSAFMICVNDLSKLKCKNKSILKDLTILLSPFTPHLCEEVWKKLGMTETISFASFPKLDESYLVESNYSYPVSVNGKMKFLLDLPIDLGKEDIEKAVMSNEKVKKLIGDKSLRKLIIVPKKIVNLVL